MSQIPDIFPVLAAASKTLLAKSRESLTTRTPHSELVYNYSGSKHVSVSLVSILSLNVSFFFLLNSLSFWHEKISESLKRCGISENSTYILVARFAASADEVRWHKQSLFASFCFWHSLSKASCYLVWICHLFHQMVAIEKLIKGKEIDLEEMERRADKPQIQKVHHFFFFSDKEFDLLCVLRSCELMIYYGWIFVSSALQNISCRARNIFSWWCNSVQDCFSRCTLKLDVKVFIVFFNLNHLVSMFHYLYFCCPGYWNWS